MAPAMVVFDEHDVAPDDLEELAERMGGRYADALASVRRRDGLAPAPANPGLAPPPGSSTKGPFNS